MVWIWLNEPLLIRANLSTFYSGYNPLTLPIITESSPFICFNFEIDIFNTGKITTIQDLIHYVLIIIIKATKEYENLIFPFLVPMTNLVQ